MEDIEIKEEVIETDQQPEPEQPPEGVPETGDPGGAAEVTGPEEEGDLIVLPDLDSDTSDGSTDDVTVSDTEGEIEEDEFVSAGGSDTVIIISPDDLAAVLQDADSISLLADYGSTGDSLPSGSFLTYCEGLVSKVPFGDHYVCWREDTDYYSDSYFAYGDLELSGGEISGDARVLTYSRQGSSGAYTLEWAEDLNFSLSVSSGWAYSDLGELPRIDAGGDFYAQGALWLLGLGLVVQFVGWVLFSRYSRY